MQNVKAYLRRGTTRESLLFYKEDLQGENPSALLFWFSCGCPVSLVDFAAVLLMFGADFVVIWSDILLLFC